MNETEKARAQKTRMDAELVEIKAKVQRTRARLRRQWSRMHRLEERLYHHYIPTCRKPLWGPVGIGADTYTGQTWCGRDKGHRGKCVPVKLVKKP